MVCEAAVLYTELTHNRLEETGFYDQGQYKTSASLFLSY
jgi:hypothetical protein